MINMRAKERCDWMKGLLQAEDEYKECIGNHFKMSDKVALDFMAYNWHLDLQGESSELIDGYLSFIEFKKNKLEDK